MKRLVLGPSEFWSIRVHASEESKARVLYRAIRVIEIRSEMWPSFIT